MSKTSFTNFCLVAIICLLAVIAMKLNTGHVYAAKSWKYETLRVLDGQAADEIQKQSQAGWELVAAPFWTYSNRSGGADGLLIFRK
jgi:ABC-type cobalt transport system substrate-binding protein